MMPDGPRVINEHSRRGFWRRRGSLSTRPRSLEGRHSLSTFLSQWSWWFPGDADAATPTSPGTIPLTHPRRDGTTAAASGARVPMAVLRPQLLNNIHSAYLRRRLLPARVAESPLVLCPPRHSSWPDIARGAADPHPGAAKHHNYKPEIPTAEQHHRLSGRERWHDLVLGTPPPADRRGAAPRPGQHLRSRQPVSTSHAETTLRRPRTGSTCGARSAGRRTRQKGSTPRVGGG